MVYIPDKLRGGGRRGGWSQKRGQRKKRASSNTILSLRAVQREYRSQQSFTSALHGKSIQLLSPVNLNFTQRLLWSLNIQLSLSQRTILILKQYKDIFIISDFSTRKPLRNIFHLVDFYAPVSLGLFAQLCMLDKIFFHEDRCTVQVQCVCILSVILNRSEVPRFICRKKVIFSLFFPFSNAAVGKLGRH